MIDVMERIASSENVPSHVRSKALEALGQQMDRITGYPIKPAQPLSSAKSIIGQAGAARDPEKAPYVRDVADLINQHKTFISTLEQLWAPINIGVLDDQPAVKKLYQTIVMEGIRSISNGGY